MADAELRRNKFYDSILSRHGSGLHAGAVALAEAWREATGASWVWLWLRNKVAGQWELVTGSPAVSVSSRPPKITFEAGSCLGDFAINTGAPVLNHLIGGPSVNLESKAHRPQFEEWLQTQGCKSIDVIPLVYQPPAVAESKEHRFLDLEIVGMVALHYRDDAVHVVQPEASLKRMAALTTHALLQSYREKQLSVLVELNELHAEFLPKPGQPGSIRAAYIREVIEVISRQIDCQAVSIFYERRWSDRAFCIGTTGLYENSSGRIVSPANPNEASYSLDRLTWTGKCIVDGEPFVRLAGSQSVGHRGKYVENPRGQSLRGNALLIMPVPRVDGDDTPSKSPVLSCGAIRCSGHRVPNFPNEDRSFDLLDIQQVAFIAWQISPVLETLASRIVREDAIAVLKHDLHSPLNMIRDGLAKVERQPLQDTGIPERQDYKVRHYDLKNMQYAVHASRSLVVQLDADPQAVRPIIPSRVFLEGDVIARLANLMGHFARIEKNIQIYYGDFRGSADGRIPSVPALRVDRDLIERVFSNLLSNAIKYGSKNSEIHIEPRLESDGLHVWVSNHGIGISPQEADRIFEPYYRTPNAMEQAAGAGLGLGIAQRIMRSHGGDVILIRLDDPTIFDVFFPKGLFM